MMGRVVDNEEEEKSKELTPIEEERSVIPYELSVVKRFGGLTFASPQVPQERRQNRNERVRVTPLLQLMNDMKLISSAKQVKDDFDLVVREKTEDDLSYREMEERYNLVALQLDERFAEMVEEEVKKDEQVNEEEKFENVDNEA